jgi:S-adenosylmethionine:tRNA ribosyltransferase-isomerase
MNKRSEYSFDLPESLIAAFPLESRADARLLVVHKNARTIESRFVRELPEILPAKSVLVANNTKVIRARLKGARILPADSLLSSATGSAPGKIEFFLLKKLAPALWQGLIRSSAKITPGFCFWVGSEDARINAEVISREYTNAGTIFTVKLSRDPVDAGMGEVPLPPYIVAKRNGQDSKDDELQTYNTVYAKHEGSVAAPTAGRHFTPELIAELRSRGIDWQEITLHVGLGTFKPVMADDIRDHTMHGESSFISDEVASSILQAKSASRPIIAVGTTSTRTLEGRAVRTCSPNEALTLEPGEKEINLFIHPGSGHDWKLIDGMLTNFHLPESTLLMMVAAFVGDLEFTKKIYHTAIAEKYRFYSYGDAMLILP